MSALAPVPDGASTSAAIERLLGRFIGYVPAMVRPVVAAFAREKMLLPPSSFATRLRERGFALEPHDTLDLWAAFLWALGDE